MRSPRSILAPLALLALAAAACGGTAGSVARDGTSADAPPGITGEPGELSGADDVEAVAQARIDTVVMVGDSITRGSTPALTERFTLLGFDTVLIDAQNNRRMVTSGGDVRSGTRTIEALLAEPAEQDSPEGIDGDHGNEIWVVALGTNDVGQYASPDEIAAAVNEVLSLVPAEVPLVWVDVYFAARAEQAAEINAIIGDRVARRGNAVIAPWTLFAPSDGVLTGDGVHPTEAGQDVFGFVVTDTVRAFLDG